MVAEIIRTSADQAFTQVTVFVGALLLLFGYINHRTSGGLVRAIERNRPWQPIIGALMGISPGCGGAIFVMPLFVRGVCSYGTLIATLIATMGDSAFVVISRLPKEALWINLISFATGVVTGYLVDALGIGRNIVRRAEDEGGDEPHLVSQEDLEAALYPPGHEDPASVGYRITHTLHWVFWAVMGVGFIIGLLLLAQIAPARMGMIGGMSIASIVGIAGTVLCGVWMLLARHFLSDDSFAESEEKLGSLKETFIHNAHETAFVGFWVFVAYAIYGLGIEAVGGEDGLQTLVTAAGVWPVVVSATIGLIPGCGPQVVLVGLYCNGIVSFPAVVANAISQDGDALLPLIAIHGRSAALATVVTTVPALIVGVALYYIM